MEKFRSIWGDGEQATLQEIDALKPGGNWLDLAAGDGRYVPELVEKVDFLTLVDIRPDDATAAINSLTDIQRIRVKSVFADLTKTLAFKNEEFDGVFCTGTLHLFSEDELRHFFAEIDRILKPSGRLIVDFATEISKTFKDGRVEAGDENLNYSTDQARKLLTDVLKGYDTNLQVSTYTDDVYNVEGYGYKAVGEFILVVATKPIKK